MTSVNCNSVWVGDKLWVGLLDGVAIARITQADPSSLESAASEASLEASTETSALDLMHIEKKTLPIWQLKNRFRVDKNQFVTNLGEDSAAAGAWSFAEGDSEPASEAGREEHAEPAVAN